MTATADATAWLSVERIGDDLLIGARGAWTVANAENLAGALDRLAADGVKRARIDLTALDGLDTAGALILYKTLDRLQAAGSATELTGASETYADLLKRVAEAERRGLGRPERIHPLLASLERLGRGAVSAVFEGRDLISFLGLTVIVMARIAVRPARLRVVSVVSHMEATGFRALPIVGLLSFLIGIVLAYQSADQLQKFGASIFTVNLLGISVLREIGILMTAIVVAGRSGSAFTAQIGTMKVREEVDAMQTLGLDPIEVLVVPRVLALVLVLPLLAFYADIMGLLGGALMSLVVLDISLTQFVQQLNAAIGPWTFWVGIIKAPFFAFLIALVGCFQGLRVSGSAESVGRLTTQSVVESIFLVIVADAIFSIVFSTLKI